MALLKAGFSVDAPRILRTYMFCSPGLDGKLRCLPSAGGYYDQNHVDMAWFRVIEKKLDEIAADDLAREKARQKEADKG